MSYYNYDFEQEVPFWVPFLCAFGLFMYQTLDNIDGKQARRTGSSSPLGELFDHVSDAMGVGMIVTTVGAACRAGPLLTLICFLCTITPFYFYHWEEYFTGELIMGQFDGPTESQCMTMGLHILAGTLIWTGRAGFWYERTLGYENRVLFCAVYCTMCVLSSLKLQLRLWDYISRKTKYSIQHVLSVAFPYFTFLICAIVYSYYNPILLTKHRWDECRLLFFLFTILFGYITSRLIVQRVLNERAPLAYPIVLPLALAAAYSVASEHLGWTKYDPHMILRALAVIALIQCIVFFIAIDLELTSYLGIRTFVLTKVSGLFWGGWGREWGLFVHLFIVNKKKAPAPSLPATLPATLPASSKRNRSKSAPRKSVTPTKSSSPRTRTRSRSRSVSKKR